ncbi:MAG TPA: EamA family transporter [Bacteroidales bacterium]|nr:EamA family transporter [Bacteroidales bacterium]
MHRDKLINWSILILLSLIWGSSFILMKKGLRSFDSIQIASLRIFISYLFLMPLAIANIRKINRDNLSSLIIIGLIGNALPAFLYPFAQRRIDSSVAGMLNALTPLFTLLAGLVLYGRKVRWSQVTGIVIGLTGAAGLLYRDSFSFDSLGLCIVLATFFYGISSNQVTLIKNINGAVITSLAFFLIGPLAGLSLLISDFGPALQTENWLQNLGFISILSIFGSGIAVGLFNILILRTSPVFASSVTYLAPIVSTLWGFADGENITLFMIISVICILAGVYLTIKQKKHV